MSERRKVDGQPAFVLHAYPYRETSLIIEVFARDYGRIALLARGARRPRSALRGLLLGFQPLELGWAGQGEVPTLMKAEWQGGQPLLTGKALFFAYYLNELLLHLLPREDAHPGLFVAYATALRRFADGASEAALRSFECSLLQELGYGLTLEQDASGQPVEAAAMYAYEIERGPVRVDSRLGEGPGVRGRTLLDMAAGDYVDARTLQEAKALMRGLIAHYTSDKDLTTRRIFKELQEL